MLCKSHSDAGVGTCCVSHPTKAVRCPSLLDLFKRVNKEDLHDSIEDGIQD